jgi:putative flavoprotein involved in K+ transport
MAKGVPLIRVKPKDLDAAGARQVARLVGAKDGKPLLEGGRALEVGNVVWCTGFEHGLDWLKLPVFDATGRPDQYRGAVVVSRRCAVPAKATARAS